MFASFLFQWVKDNVKRQEGQAMAEYGIILALIAVICIVAVGLLGGKINTALNSVVNAI
jgi:pilus assembly protein Flp/PilA